MQQHLYAIKIIVLVILFLPPANLFSDSKLEKENKDLYRTFVSLMTYGPDNEFYEHAERYEQFLKKNNMMEEYFKIKTNEGFFDLNKKNILRGLKTVEQLKTELHEAEATEFYYLATGLEGDLNKAIRNPKADSIYRQALKEVGDRDPKFSMLVHMNLAQVNYMTNREESFRWANLAQSEAEKLNNYEYRSLSIGLKCYLYFMMGKREEFELEAQHYQELKESFDSLEAANAAMGKQRFSHNYDLVIEVAKLAFDGKFAEAIEMANDKHLNVDRQMVIYCALGMEGQYEKEKSTKRLKWGFGLMTFLYFFVYFMGRRRLWLKIQERQAKLKVAQEQAEAANKMKAAFIRSMSHEIRTPLNAINGFSQILCSSEFDLQDEEKKDLRERITSNVEAITIIINELLELAAGESVTLDLNDLNPIRINEVCRNVVAMSEEHNDKDLHLEFKSTLDDSFAIKSNEETVSQILQKIIDNALKFTEEGSVCVEVGRKGKTLEISVTDTGIGIPADKQETIFDNFVKLNDFKGGVGLGLSISRRLAKTLGGNIILDNTYTTGSRFIIQLPIIMAQKKAK